MLRSMRVRSRGRDHLIQARSGRNPAWRRALRGAAVGLGLVACGRLVASRCRRVVVVGDSMRPALEPGDRLLVVRGGRPRVGALVALADPRAPERVLVKRVLASDEHGIEVRGDNPTASTDSRHFGPVPPRALVGRVVRRYAPAHRRGRVR